MFFFSSGKVLLHHAIATTNSPLNTQAACLGIKKTRIEIACQIVSHFYNTKITVHLFTPSSPSLGDPMVSTTKLKGEGKGGMIGGQSNGEGRGGLCTLSHDRSSLGDPPRKGLVRKCLR